jgi:superfamily I DNA/RNA helicase
MTLHKAKGLEFDHVFMPALAAGTARNSDVTAPHLERIGNARPIHRRPALLRHPRSARGATDARAGCIDFLKRASATAEQRPRSRAPAVCRLHTRRAAPLWLSASLPWKEDRADG